MPIHNLSTVRHETAYDKTQCDNQIKDGHILIVRGGLAIMAGAWPTMLVGQSEHFHQFEEPPRVLDMIDGQGHEITLADGRRIQHVVAGEGTGMVAVFEAGSDVSDEVLAY